MKFIPRPVQFCLCLLLSQFPALAGNSIHTTWLWHLHQPVYWPDRRAGAGDHYEAAWDTVQQQDGGRPHPSPEILRNIFGLDDRRNAYQSGPRNSLANITGYPKAGVQISYSGALMENVQSLGVAGQLGYGSGWFNGNREARGWTTSGGNLSLKWNVMPGHTYQLESANALGGVWSNVVGTLTTAGPLQIELDYSTALPSAPVQQFYRLKLLL